MSARTTHITSLVIFVTAAFFVGLVAGVSIGRSSAEPAQPHASNGENPDGPQENQKAADFVLEDFDSGDTFGLKDFAGSNLMLIVSTTA